MTFPIFDSTSYAGKPGANLTGVYAWGYSANR